MQTALMLCSEWYSEIFGALQNSGKVSVQAKINWWNSGPPIGYEID
jgi:hypothetical protein